MKLLRDWLGPMPKSLRIAIFAVGGFVALLVLVAAALSLFLDNNAYKARLEAAVSDAVRMEVRVGGRLGINFFPGFLVTLEDVHIRNRGVDVASAREVRLAVDFLPLLRQEVRVKRVRLQNPIISIERGRDGQFNFEKPDVAGDALSSLELPNIYLAGGTVIYADKQSGEEMVAADCTLDVARLRILRRKGSEFMKDLSARAELACGEIRAKNFVASDLKVSADGKDGIFVFKPVTMRVMGAQGAGNMQADFSGAVPLYHIRFALPQFRIEEFFKSLSPQKVAAGAMDFSMNLSLQGKTVNEMKRKMEGQVSLGGENLTLNGSDLDQTFSRVESSQNFNLVDVGAFFFAGPFGLMVTKGYDFASIFQGSGGSSKIRKLVSDWKIRRGVAQAQDVAMATNRNRVALRGNLDFVNERFVGVTVALIDAGGCIKVQQKIGGAFEKPVVEKPNVLESLAGPAIRLFKKGRDLFTDEKCKVFYAGSVTAPG